MYLIPSELQSFQPPEQIPVWEWIEKHRVLNRRSSSEIGPKRVSRTPALKILYDWFEDPKIRKVVVQKPAQIGLTDLVVDLILWIAVNDPSPTALFLADQDTARKIMKFRIDPAFREMGLIKHSSANKSQEATKFEITLRNGFYLMVSWGSSISQTGSMAFKRIFCDEVNKPGYDATKTEGGSLDRIEERMETFSDSKFFIFSTPTIDTGRVTKELETCDTIYDFKVQCPFCGEKQPLSFRQVIWDGGGKATREQIEKTCGYKCVKCGKKWSEEQRKNAVSEGVPEPREKKENLANVGYQLHRLASLFKGGNLSTMIYKWIHAQGDQLKLQNVINSTFGEPYIPRISAKPDEAILQVKRCKSEIGLGILPPDYLALVVSVDVQQVGFWYRLRAFMPDLTSFGIEEDFLSTWEEIEEIVFRHENGLPKIWRMMIDTGGGKEEGAKISRTTETYQWIIDNRCRGVRIFACKGASHQLPSNIKVGTPLEKFPSGKPIPGGLQIVQINTDSFKDELWSRIDKTIKDKTLPRSWFVHGETPEYVFDQICAEEKRRNKDGSAEWVQIRPDNHMLDLECLCLAAADFELFGGIRPLQVQRAQEKRKISRPAPSQEVKPRQENPILRRY